MQAKERWNFDFKNDMPLPGRYGWIRIDSDRNKISDFTQSTTGMHNLQEERLNETEKANTKKEKE